MTKDIDDVIEKLNDWENAEGESLNNPRGKLFARAAADEMEMDQAVMRRKKLIAERLARDTQRQARLGAIEKQVSSNIFIS